MCLSRPLDLLLWHWMVLVLCCLNHRTGSTVLAEKKRNYLTLLFAILILRLQLSHNAIKNIGFTMTWLSHYVIFQIRQGNKLAG